jgi:hypothetical protein
MKNELLKAEEHPLLKDLETQMHGAQIKGDTSICGRKYTFETLWPWEEAWADAYVDGVNLYQAGRGRRLPYIAAALRAIDDVPLELLFKVPVSASLDEKDALSDPKTALAWRRDQLYRRMANEPPLFAPEVLAEMWSFYQSLEERRRQSLEKIGPLSRRAGDGASSLTSSPEKAS